MMRAGTICGLIEGSSETRADLEPKAVKAKDLSYMKLRLQKIIALTDEIESRLEQFDPTSPTYRGDTE